MAAVAAGVGALILAHAHRPIADTDPQRIFGRNVLGMLSLYKKTGSVWSVTAYDAVHIVGIVLIALGGAGLIIALGPIARRGASRRRPRTESGTTAQEPTAPERKATRSQAA